MKFGAPFKRLFYKQYFELARGKYIRFSEIAGTLIFLFILKKSC